MNIRWDNVFALMLIIFAVYLFIKMRPFFQNLFEEINSVGIRHGDPLVAVSLFGLLCITIVAAIKIIFGTRR